MSAAGTPHFGGGPPEEGRVKLPTNKAQKIEQTASLTVRSVAVIRHGGSRPIQRSAWKGNSPKFARNGVLRSSPRVYPDRISLIWVMRSLLHGAKLLL